MTKAIKSMHIWLLIAWTLAACGPDTIFLRPGLDTPAQHVSNGYAFMEQEKAEAACREFERARELDPDYTDAYVGLGLALGRRGQIARGMALMDQANALAKSDAERERVQQGYEQLLQMLQMVP